MKTVPISEAADYHLKAGSRAFDKRMKVGRGITYKGIQVAISPMSKSKGYDDRLEHTDDGDLFIQQRIEVKGLSADFTSGSDWPFRGEFIVCAAHSYDQAKPKPYAYMILNRNRTHVAIVYGKSRPHWTTKRIKDGRYEDMTQEFYLCPLEHVDFRIL